MSTRELDTLHQSLISMAQNLAALEDIHEWKLELKNREDFWENVAQKLAALEDIRVWHDWVVVENSTPSSTEEPIETTFNVFANTSAITRVIT